MRFFKVGVHAVTFFFFTKDLQDTMDRVGFSNSVESVFEGNQFIGVTRRRRSFKARPKWLSKDLRFAVSRQINFHYKIK